MIQNTILILSQDTQERIAQESLLRQISLFRLLSLSYKTEAKQNMFDYSWIACQLEVGTTLAFLLTRSNFKSETNFGFLDPNNAEHVT